MTTTFMVEVDAWEGKLYFFDELYFFKALFAGNVAQAYKAYKAYNFIHYIQTFLFGQ